ncbi:unnamed protein product [Didymodactylos carnosus]|uniref:AAA+ ATPase domain-containing protein n=1 Tax=Didymodactylos carnosus TaxID=1234261 RepID=A0A814XPE9_9BILA|nr:unnamed protein product [Didymodactylos carnosus]CAF3981802.1 unnamed protein product [Didymodactylos carnosus]
MSESSSSSSNTTKSGDPSVVSKSTSSATVSTLTTSSKSLNPNTFLSNSALDSEKEQMIMSDVYIDLGNYVSLHINGGYLVAKSGNDAVSLENPLNLKPDYTSGAAELINDEDDEEEAASQHEPQVEGDSKAKETFCVVSSITVNAYYVPEHTANVRSLLAALSKFKLYYVKETSLQMVCFNPQSGFYTTYIKVKRPLIKDLKLNYGESFVKTHKRLLGKLTKTNSTGITFLHGPPGTGKTFYIRYLINEIKDKSLIYVPPDLVNEMTKPGFMPFLMQHPNSILIIEDAENIILDRKDQASSTNQAVSNLLNLSDGLLGDAMHQQIITTFNCDIKGIDPALLRDGRLVLEYQFDKLSVEQAKLLAKELGFADLDKITTPMPLAEIYEFVRKNKE